MKKVDIARRMALESGVTRAEAADRLDRVVHRILTSLKQGRTANLPGLGTFAPGHRGAEFTRERKGSDVAHD